MKTLIIISKSFAKRAVMVLAVLFTTLKKSLGQVIDLFPNDENMKRKSFGFRFFRYKTSLIIVMFTDAEVSGTAAPL